MRIFFVFFFVYSVGASIGGITLSTIMPWQPIEIYRSELLKYCCTITGSRWDGEDLFQETVIKALNRQSKSDIRQIPKSYLFRIASNAWIDRCRKQRIDMDLYTDVNDLSGESTIDLEDVKEAIDILIKQLSEKQQIVFLLMEVFQYTASEVAEKIATTEGAVKALLSRARKKLRKIAESDVAITGEDSSTLKEKGNTELLTRVYLEAFKRRDPDTIFLLLDSNAYANVVQFKQVYSKKNVHNSTNRLVKNLGLRQRYTVIEGKLTA
jgi:RNA polymerase sigma factor (sigma-70 family)